MADDAKEINFGQQHSETRVLMFSTPWESSGSPKHEATPLSGISRLFASHADEHHLSSLPATPEKSDNAGMDSPNTAESPPPDNIPPGIYTDGDASCLSETSCDGWGGPFGCSMMPLRTTPRWSFPRHSFSPEAPAPTMLQSRSIRPLDLSRSETMIKTLQLLPTEPSRAGSPDPPPRHPHFNKILHTRRGAPFPTLSKHERHQEQCK
ncbi:hypothetical protein BV25DRAFT_1709925 [Artomyces pyxidatus]|uniref:Uncharacterized protein n=1 Tax=Artomyces pyxidatus TaxID=48021 RepID=A0ACB8TB01_9AGAM|nr:hypothetical protein BV25DRAFT_1709925 [Artomyces pyxidatus]